MAYTKWPRSSPPVTRPRHDHVRVEFESRDFRSWVKFEPVRRSAEGQAVQAQAGMESYFDSLEAFLT